MAPDIEELHEHAHQGNSDARLRPVSVTMSILAVLVAVVSLMGARIHADAMLAETRATDQWSQYQAKAIRERSYEVFLDQLTVFAVQDAAHAVEVKAKYAKEITRYTGEMKDIQTQATATQNDVDKLERRSNWFDIGEVLLETSLVVCSITILTQKRMYWYLGLTFGGSGFLIALIGLFIR